MKAIKLEAKSRDEHGRSASRRLRHSGLIPAIIYGSEKDATPISIDHNTIFYALREEEFHTSILNMKVDGKDEKVLLRDYQMHAYRPQVMHIDFQRVSEKEEIQIKVPLHFINEETAVAVKTQGAHITHIVNEVEIRAKALDLPHFIEIDMQEIEAGQTIHLSDLKLPKGVSLVSLIRGEDAPVAMAANISEEKEEEVEVVAAADVPTADGEGEKAEEAASDSGKE